MESPQADGKSFSEGIRTLSSNVFGKEVVLPKNEEHFKEVAQLVATPLATGKKTVYSLAV